MQKVPETTGFPDTKRDHVTGRQRPLSMAWITDELLARTQRVWSRAYQRTLEPDEAVEILMNVKRLAEALLQAKREVKHNERDNLGSRVLEGTEGGLLS